MAVWRGDRGDLGDRWIMARFLKNAAAFLLGLLIALFWLTPASAAQVATGYGLDGSCYSTPDRAFEGFRRGLPTIRDGFVTTLNSASIAGNVLTYSITTRDFASGTAKTLTGNVTLSSCQSVTGYMSDNMAGLLFASLIAFFTAFWLRKAIRKFSRFAGGFASDF